MFCLKIKNLHRNSPIIVIIFYIFAINTAFAQVDTSSIVPIKPWKFDGTYIINFNQSSFTNWVSGGQNQIGLSSILKPILVFDNNRWSWTIQADIRFGLLKVSTDRARKSDDVIRLESKLGRRISKKWKFSGIYMYNSQFMPSYDNDNSDRILSAFMAPAYTNLSLGFDNNPNSHLSIYLTPTNLRSTYVLNDSLSARGEFGVEPGSKVLLKLGPSALISYKDEVFKDFFLDTKLGYFQNVLDGLGDPVINWDAILTMKFNKYLSTTFTFTLFYDPDSKIDVKDPDGNVVGKIAKVQFKQTLGVGFDIAW